MGATATEAFAVKDGRGNVTGYYRGQGSNVGVWLSAEYTPEGRVTQKDWVANTTCAETGVTKCPRMGGVPFGFHSAYKSPAHGLLYFRNRWYSTEAGQWLSHDPLGEVDSANLYAFNRFDSVNYIDPWGLGAGKGLAESACEMNHTCPYEPGSRKPLEHKGDVGGPTPPPATPDLSAAQARAADIRDNSIGSQAPGTGQGSASSAPAVDRPIRQGDRGPVRRTRISRVPNEQDGWDPEVWRPKVYKWNVPAPATESPVKKPKLDPFWYVTYTKVLKRNPKVVYTGRTAGYGKTPDQVVRERDRNHHIEPNNRDEDGNPIPYGERDHDANEWEDAKVDRALPATLEPDKKSQDPAYKAIRGREQQMIDRNGGAQRQGGSSGNPIRGVRVDNPRGGEYWNWSTGAFGAVHGYTGDPRFGPSVSPGPQTSK